MSKISIIKSLAVVFVAAFLVWLPVRAFNVVIDYSYDTGFFKNNATAQAAIERAAADISAVITTNLNATGNGAYTLGSSYLNVKSYAMDPVNPLNASGTVNSVEVSLASAANEFRVYVGATALPSGSNTLGAAVANSISLGGSAHPSDINNIINLATTDLMRGAAVEIGGFAPWDGYNNLSYGLLGGSFFVNTNYTWHYDYTTNVGFFEYDLYSVALHEMLHAIGFGTSTNWDNLFTEAGGLWGGQAAKDEAGKNNLVYVGGTPRDGSYGAHIANGITSSSIVDGSQQDPVMSYSIANGTRKELTYLDLAFLEDLGFTVDYNALNAAIPEPATMALLLGAGMLVLTWFRRCQ